MLMLGIARHGLPFCVPCTLIVQVVFGVSTFTF